MKVELHLRQLLFRHDCVVLPGFGAFLLRHKSAVYNAEEHFFAPPERKLSFNAQLTESDALLATEISRAESITFNEGEICVENFVQQLKQHLNTHKTVELEGVGDFQVDGHQLIFKPARSQNFLLDAFGLQRFSKAPVERINVQNPAKETETETQAEPATITIGNSGKEEEESNRKTKTYPYLKYAAIGIVAIGLSGFLGLSWYSDSVKEHNLQAQQEAEKAVEQKIQTATFSIQNPLPEIKLDVTREKGKYHIIAGAFRNGENAYQKVKKLRKEGFKAREIGVNKYDLHQVAYESFDDRLKSLKALRSIKKEHNSEAWLFVKQL